MNNSYITIIKEKRTVLSRKRVPLNQNECTADFRIGVPFEQNLQCWHSPPINWCSKKNHICGSNFINCRICIILIDASLRALTDSTSLAWCNVEFVGFNDFNFILFWRSFYKCIDCCQRISFSGTSINDAFIWAIANSFNRSIGTFR